MSISTRKFVYVISLVFFLLSNTTLAAETLKNTGLITRNIWYSKDPFYAGDKIRIYSVIFNGSNLDLRGRVNFYDKGSLLCTSEFAVLSGRVSDVWCDWSVAAGKHSVSIKITNPRGSLPGGDESAVLLSSDELATSEMSVGNEPSTFSSASPVLESKVASVNTQPQSVGVVGKILDIFGIQPSNQAQSDLSLPQRSLPQSSHEYKKTIVSPSKVSRAPNLESPTDFSGVTAVNSDKGYLNNIASVWDAFKEFMSRVPFLSQLRDWILNSLKSYTNTNSKPFSYVALFVYVVVKFILESPIILTLLIIYTTWWLFRRAIRDRY